MSFAAAASAAGGQESIAESSSSHTSYDLIPMDTSSSSSSSPPSASAPGVSLALGDAANVITKNQPHSLQQLQHHMHLEQQQHRHHCHHDQDRSQQQDRQQGQGHSHLSLLSPPPAPTVPIVPVSSGLTHLYSLLHPGAKLKGNQRCGSSFYDVNVELKHVDFHASFLCGYLTIYGLTADLPSLTTFFEAEIIGERHSFLTHNRWRASPDIDFQHWSRFPPFVKQVLDKAIIRDPHYVHDLADSDYVFMRWKEQFLVPDHRVASVNGASFAGFYYICFQKSTRKISGLYFHQSSEWFQSLALEYMAERSFPRFDFR